MADIPQEFCDNGANSSFLSEILRSEVSPDEEAQRCLLLNDFRITHKLVKEENEDGNLEEHTHIFAEKDGKYYRYRLSNREAQRLSNTISKSAKDIDLILKRFTKNPDDPRFKVRISEDALLEFTTRGSWLDDFEDNFKIQLEEEKLDPLQLSQRVLKSSIGLNKKLETILLNIIMHNEKTQQDMKVINANFEEKIAKLEKKATEAEERYRLAQLEIANLKKVMMRFVVN